MVRELVWLIFVVGKEAQSFHADKAMMSIHYHYDEQRQNAISRRFRTVNSMLPSSNANVSNAKVL